MVKKRTRQFGKVVIVRKSKEKLINMANGMLLFFQFPDSNCREEPYKTLGFGQYMNIWAGNSNECLPFLIKKKAVSIKRRGPDSKALKGRSNEVTIYKDKTIKMKNDLEKSKESYIQIGKRLYYGDKKNKRSIFIK